MTLRSTNFKSVAYTNFATRAGVEATARIELAHIPFAEE